MGKGKVKPQWDTVAYSLMDKNLKVQQNKVLGRMENNRYTCIPQWDYELVPPLCRAIQWQVKAVYGILRQGANFLSMTQSKRYILHLNPVHIHPKIKFYRNTTFTMYLTILIFYFLSYSNTFYSLSAFKICSPQFEKHFSRKVFLMHMQNIQYCSEKQSIKLETTKMCINRGMVKLWNIHLFARTLKSNLE